MHRHEKLDFCPSINRQVKDQNKKVANLKHKEQVEKKKSAQMLEEARRREDNLNDSSQQLQVRALESEGLGEKI
jgi:ELKS/RAB6-interacting/CAST family protein 1